MMALNRIWVVASNTYREAVRDKLLYNLLLFAVLMIASSILLAKIHHGYDERIYYDVGLGAIALFGVLIAIFVGVNLVYREISQKTIYTMLSKPVRRWEFLTGKYLGLVSLLALEIALMSTFFLGVVWYKGTLLFPAQLLYAISLIFVELVLITAVAIFFSSFTTPYLAAMFTVGIWLIGHLLADLREFGNLPDSEHIRPITEALYWGLPNLDRLDIKGPAAAGDPIDRIQVAWRAGYGLIYSTALVMGGVLLFRRRDFR
jgi:ABC-type transport system involved in multi-copper enzyme maturation permease subunit